MKKPNENYKVYRGYTVFRLDDGNWAVMFGEQVFQFQYEFNAYLWIDKKLESLR